TTANKDTDTEVDDPDRFREVLLDYYMAELRLSTDAEKKAQEAQREYTELMVADAIKSVDVEYAKSSSATNPPTSGWNTEHPTWEDGMFIWSRTHTIYKNNTSDITEPVNITGAKGESGEGGTPGRSIVSIQEQYYLSNSLTSLTDGEWVSEPPTWQ